MSLTELDEIAIERLRAACEAKDKRIAELEANRGLSQAAESWSQADYEQLRAERIALAELVHELLFDASKLPADWRARARAALGEP